VTVRPVLRWPDRRLSRAAAPVAGITDEIHAIWTDMIDTMEAMPGVGLAAPQIGVMRCLAVVDASETRGEAVRLANPSIVAVSGELREHDEASPCLPGISARLSRPAEVRVRFLDEAGQEVERDFSGLWSTSVQHQIDHLSGRLFIDRLSRMKRDMALRRYRKGAT